MYLRGPGITARVETNIKTNKHANFLVIIPHLVIIFCSGKSNGNNNSAHQIQL